MLALGLFAIPQISTVAAAGTLYVTPPLVSNLPIGSTFTVQLKVASIDQFNGWEIQVISDPTVISPVSISTSGNIFQANTTGGISFETRNCVNGSGTGCCLTNACSPTDGPGIADSSYADTKLASGSGLLFTVTFQVVSNKPMSPISIQNDVFSNGSNSGVIHTTSSGQYGSLASIAVSKFFTDASFNPLPLDGNLNPSLTVVLARTVVRSTNPGEILAWVEVTNTSPISLQSLTINDTLPIDWAVSPQWNLSTGAIHVYYGNASLATNPEITDPSTITVSTGNPETVSLALSNLNNTAIAHPLQPGQSILLSVKLSYGLTKTIQSFPSFPRNYTDTATAAGFPQPSYTGSSASGTGSALFVAYLNIVGNPGHDNPIIDIAKAAIQ